MTGRYIRVFFTVLTLLALASTSHAARRSSLAGNLLIQDADDVFFFPHLVNMHKRMVTFDLGPNAAVGSGGLVFGNESVTFGAFTHRSDFLGALPDAFFTRGDIDHIGNGIGTFPSGGLTAVGPGALNWIDALVGWQMGETPWGLRFSLGRGNSDPAPANVSDDVTAFNAIVGTRIAQWNTDASVEFAFASANDETAISKTEASPFHVGVAVRRTASEESDALTLGWLGMFDWTSGSTDVTPTGGTKATTDHTAYDVVAGLGPVYKPSDRTNVAMYGTFELQSRKTDASSGATTDVRTTRTIGIPGWNIAAEVELASWIQFRCGMRSRFTFKDVHTETATDTHDKNNNLDFGWTTGVGMKVGSLQIDGMLNPDVVTTGTDLLGDSSALFGLVSTTFHF